MSILTEVQNRTQKKWFYKKIALIVFFIIVWIAVWYYFLGYSKFKDIEVLIENEYVVKSGDISIYIQWEWKIVADDTIDLAFKISDKIKKIYKKPWDILIEWEKIIELDNDLLQINLQKAQVYLQQAKANLDLKQYPITDIERSLYEEQLNTAKINSDISQIQSKIDINNAEITVNNARINVDILQKELWIASWTSNSNLVKLEEEANLSNKKQTAIMEIWSSISILEMAINDIDLIWWFSDLNKSNNDSFEIYLSARNTTLRTELETLWHTVNLKFQDFTKIWQEYKVNPNYEEVIQYVDKMIELTKNATELTQTAVDSMRLSVSSSTLTANTIENHITNLESHILKLKSAVHSISTSSQNIQIAQKSLETEVLGNSIDLQNKLAIAQNEYDKAKAQYENAIQKAESNKQIWQKQVDIAKVNLDIKNQKLSSQESKIYELAITQAEINLAEANKKFLDSIIFAPSSGVLVGVNFYEWEIIGWNSVFGQMKVDGEKYIESYVEESEINKVYNWQVVNIELDSIDWVMFTWKVFFVSEVWQTDENWITTYKVLIKYFSQDTKIRNWMWVSLHNKRS